MTPAELFEQLDSKCLQVAQAVGLVHVYSIREVQGRYWMQLGVAQEPGPEVTLIVRAPVTVDPPTVLARVQTWLERGDGQPVEIVEIE